MKKPSILSRPTWLLPTKSKIDTLRARVVACAALIIPGYASNFSAEALVLIGARSGIDLIAELFAL